MLSNKIVKFILSIILGVVFFTFIHKCMVEPNGVKIKISEIKEEYKGVVIDKYSTRDTPPTFLKILVSDNKVIDVSPYEAVVDNAEIGDSIIKVKNENIVYLKRDNEPVKTYFYTKISYKTRNNKRFPKEWKDKWPESSEWDINNKP